MAMQLEPRPLIMMAMRVGAWGEGAEVDID
jgi:hypothetical protein